MYLPITLESLETVHADNEAFRADYAFLTPSHPYYNDFSTSSDNELTTRYSEKFGLKPEHVHEILKVVNPIVWLSEEFGYLILYGFDVVSTAAIKMRLADPVFQAEKLLRDAQWEEEQEDEFEDEDED